MGDDSPPSDRLVWADLEMTGLDVERHRIVELAVLVTDLDLDPLDEGVDLVVRQPPEVLDAMDDVVREMHTRSRLLAEIELSTLSLEAAGTEALTYVAEHVPEPRTAPLCGNSIGVDRRFLDRYLPAFDRYLHYRSIDVSSLKELCRRWYPEVYGRRPDKRGAHRALDDVKESIEELRFYRTEMLR